MTTGRNWYQQSEHEVLEAQRTSKSAGLSKGEVAKRTAEFGANKLEGSQRKSGWKIFVGQFCDLLILVLIGAAIIAGVMGEPLDAVAIIAIIALNAVLGFYQEYRAERAMEALKALVAPLAKVRRSHQVASISAHELVPGDIVLLEAGNIVPADLRVIEAFQLEIDESTLTGESLPVPKVHGPVATDTLAVSDQKNMAFKGTIVTSGRATGVAIGTGMATELGRIAQLLKDEVEVKTPLQKRMASFAKWLSLAVVALCAILFFVGLAKKEEPVLMFMTALSLAVAAIPEALPAVITVALALGARAMSRRKALIRKLPAVEALGSVTYICSDKTGTLTLNQMHAQGFYVNGIFSPEIIPDWSKDAGWGLLVKGLALNNDVTFGPKNELQGDPTETALVRAAIEVQHDKRRIEAEFPRTGELPFSSERGMMSTVHASKNRKFILSKGAPERILPLCEHGYGPNGLSPINREALVRASEDMASKGFRVLAFAHRPLTDQDSKSELSTLENKLVFVGFVGLIDPPRDEAKGAVRLCKSSGIQVVMITGDHPLTAKAIATQLGIIESGGESIVTGEQLLEFSDTELRKKVPHARVYARVAPEQKIRIVKALQSVGEIVSMTGDGVNDAPALRAADVGVSMGKGGTDVAREASHVVLLDDNFATIVAAVREGRRIYDNIRKFIRFALSGNSGEIWTLFLAPFFGLPIPLLPIHILWVNLVTDGLPGLALALEPEERNIMQKPPRHPKENVFARGLWQHVLGVGLLTAATTLGTLAWAYHTDHAHWQSMAFTVLTFVQMGHVLAIRSDTESLFTLGLRSNLALFAAVLVTLALQLATLYVPTFNRLFRTEPLSWEELLICFLVSTSVFIAVEIEKFIRRRRA